MLQRVSVPVAILFSLVVGASSVHAEVVVEPPAAPEPAPPAPPAAPAVAPAAPQARVHVRSTKSGLIVARITERMFVAGSGGGTASGIAWKDLCMAPCEFDLEPGLHELMIKGEGHTPLIRQLNLAAGDQYFVAKPGSSGLRVGGYGVAVIGLTAALLGATYLLLPQSDDYNPTTNMFEAPKARSWPLPVLLGGVAVTGIGIGMFIAARSSLEPEAGPQVSDGGVVRRAISYRTSF